MTEPVYQHSASEAHSPEREWCVDMVFSIGHITGPAVEVIVIVGGVYVVRRYYLELNGAAKTVAAFHELKDLRGYWWKRARRRIPASALTDLAVSWPI